MGSINHQRAKLFNILHKPSPQNKTARYVNYVLAFMIFTNAFCVALETVSWMQLAYHKLFVGFEILSTCVFVVEYLSRLWVCVEQARFSASITGRIRYALTPLAILDLLVIATVWTSVDLRFLRMARIVRLLRVLHLENFEESLQRIAKGLRTRKELIIVSITLMVICIYAASAVVYQLEHKAQPTVFTSIPATFWWGIVSLTTIGYGDMIPQTPLGRLFAGCIFVFGIGVFALPMAIVTAVIIEASADNSPSPLCKKCGHPINAEKMEKPHSEHR
jgi:voltage-gated potassium channel